MTQRVDLGQLKIGKDLGIGCFGRVREATGTDGRFFAVKYIEVGEGFVPENVDKKCSELFSLDFPAILPIVGWSLPDANCNYVRIVYDLKRDASLRSILDGRQFETLCDANTASKSIIGIILGLRFMNARGIRHGNLTPSNIFWDKETELLRIGGFGRVIAESCGFVATHVPGSAGYLSPELIDSNPVTEKTDVFAFGLVLWEILTGTRACFPVQTIMQAAQFFVDEGLQTLVRQKGKRIPGSTRALIEKCWSINPDGRPTLEGLKTGFRENWYRFFPNSITSEVEGLVDSLDYV
jgi:serine/threonine protein kinase